MQMFPPQFQNNLHCINAVISKIYNAHFVYWNFMKPYCVSLRRPFSLWGSREAGHTKYMTDSMNLETFGKSEIIRQFPTILYPPFSESVLEPLAIWNLSRKFHPSDGIADEVNKRFLVSSLSQTYKILFSPSIPVKILDLTLRRFPLTFNHFFV